MTTIPNIFPADLWYATFPTDGSEPFLNMEVNPMTGCPDTNVILVPIQCEMTNIRGGEAEFNLDDAGFKFVTHKSSFNDFKNDEEIKRVYYKESVEVLREHTGAPRIVIYDHTIRRQRPVEEETSILRRPALRVHVDQSPEAAVNRVRKHVPELAEELLKHRYQIINLWRPIGVPALDTPLALCDFRSIDPEKDLVPTKLVYADGSLGKIYSVAYNPAHKWMYVRGMTPEEIVLIKNADTKMGVANTTPHSAFIDPTTPEDAPLRESIELRALLFYDNLPIES